MSAQLLRSRPGLVLPDELPVHGNEEFLAVFSEAMAIDLWDKGVRTMVVYPGVVDTELFTIPDNDPPQW